MNVGMLWLDGEATRDVPSRIRRAAEYYRSKYGKVPNVCIVHPAMLPGESLKAVSGVEVRTSPSILKDHLWLGVDETRT